MLIVTDDRSGITASSVQSWRENRQLFGTFVEGRVYAGADLAVIDGRLFRRPNDRVGYPEPPKMVLIDDRRCELWLSGDTVWLLRRRIRGRRNNSA